MTLKEIITMLVIQSTRGAVPAHFVSCKFCEQTNNCLTLLHTAHRLTEATPDVTSGLGLSIC